MHLLSSLLLGISTNLDNLFLGFSLGVRQKKLTAASNWLIGLFSAAATCLFCCVSSLCAGLGPSVNLVGAVLLFLLGIWTLFPSSTAGEASCNRQDTAILGTVLAVNCIPVAFAVGLTGIHPLAAALSVGLLSVLAMRLGHVLGLRTAALPLGEAPLRYLSGGTMMLLGLLQLLV